MSQATKGYIIAMVGITIWSTTGILIGYLITTYAIPALLLSFWRNVLVSIAMVPALFLIRRSLLGIDRGQFRFFILYGLILAVFNAIWILSVQANGAAVSTVLAYSSVGFTAILARWLFKEQLGMLKIAAIVLSLTGCVLVANAYDPKIWNVNLLGIITGLLSGLLFAAYNMMGKEAARRQINPWTSLFYSFAVASIFGLMLNFIPILPGSIGTIDALLPALPSEGWLILIVLSFVPTLLGFGLYITAMNYLPASTVSLLATSEPAMTAVEAYIFLDERMTVIQIVGSLIILLAVVIVRFEREEQPALLPDTA